MLYLSQPNPHFVFPWYGLKWYFMLASHKVHLRLFRIRAIAARKKLIIRCGHQIKTTTYQRVQSHLEIKRNSTLKPWPFLRFYSKTARLSSFLLKKLNLIIKCHHLFFTSAICPISLKKLLNLHHKLLVKCFLIIWKGRQMRGRKRSFRHWERPIWEIKVFSFLTPLVTSVSVSLSKLLTEKR
jgi:hypothetical protein